MRLIPVVAALLLGAGLVPASAAGCLKGAAVGGVAGHVAGHHGLLGAAAGCAVGRHEANKHARQAAAAQPTATSSPAAPAGSSAE